MSDAKFRPDIQVLRGVAILAVLVYHLNSKWLPSGFLGVDLFFVVSGYLMALLYVDAPITAPAYWSKRARRILAAYFAVIAATLAVSYFLVLPHEFRDVTRSAIYSTLLIPNVGFWGDVSYFETGIFRPLLHLWSLGVEAQFYLVFPLVLWVWRRHPALVIALAVLSFVACLAALQVSPKTPFFLTPFRLWEFLIGFLASAAAHRFEGKGAAGAVCLAVALALFAVPASEAQHPGLITLVECLAVAGCLAFGLPKGLLNSVPAKGLVVVGNYSYSLYLVHFPVIIFLFYEPFSGSLGHARTYPEILLAVGIMVPLTSALFHLVERPGRHLKNYIPAAAICLVLALALPFAQRTMFSPRQLKILDAWSDRGVYRCGKVSRILHPTALSCEISPGLESILLVGDSHADAIKEQIRESAMRNGLGVRLMVANCALGDGICTVAAVAQEAQARGMRAVVIHASPPASKAQPVLQMLAEGMNRDFAVVIIDPVPVWAEHVPQRLYQHRVEKRGLADYAARNADFLAALDPVQRLNRLVTAPLFCSPDCADVTADGRPLYFDAGHLTRTGSRRLAPALDHAFATIAASDVTPTPRNGK